MDSFVNFVLNGNVDFNAESIVRIMAVCLILECISSICSSLLHIGGMK